jgi:hypothetical protein
MGEYNPANPLPVFKKVRDIGNNDIHTQQLGFWEHQAGIDDDDVITPAHRHAIHAEFAEAAERH